ncbi:MAG: PleD family two-component system response regulator [Chloroflexota bacterium]
MNDRDAARNPVRKTALIVEDSPVQALALQNLLEFEGLQVLLASDGQSGLDLAVARHPDVIILDFNMPGMNGLEACRRLHQDLDTCDIPVILMTGSPEEEIFTSGLQEGAVEFIPKDAFSNIVLVETLRQLHVLSFSGASGYGF